jgi:hypothetical protein
MAMSGKILGRAMLLFHPARFASAASLAVVGWMLTTAGVVARAQAPEVTVDPAAANVPSIDPTAEPVDGTDRNGVTPLVNFAVGEAF